jgi:hypothetical protein
MKPSIGAFALPCLVQPLPAPPSAFQRPSSQRRRPDRRVLRLRGAGTHVRLPEDAGDTRVVAYLSDFRAVDGTAELFGQMAAVDRCAASRLMAVMRYHADSGRPNGPPSYGHALVELVRDVRFGDVVIVQHIARFASEYAMALRVALTLSARGVKVVEALGGDVRIEADLVATLERTLR